MPKIPKRFLEHLWKYARKVEMQLDLELEK